MASQSTYGGPGISPTTYPNKPGGKAKGAAYAGKHERADAHVQDGMNKAAVVAKKNRGQ